MVTTITQALAELKTIAKRIEKKREFILGIIGRQDALKDPHLAAGGSPKLIAQEQQAIFDLELRMVRIRAAIAKANVENSISVAGMTDTIANWLSWRRDIAPARKQFAVRLQGGVNSLRSQAQQKGFRTVKVGEAVSEELKDVIINVDELQLAKDIEFMEQVGELDGMLSLKNATILITVEGED